MSVLEPPYHSLSPGVSLFMEKGQVEVVPPTVDQFERHVDRWQAELTWFVDSKSERFRPFELRYRDFPRRNLEPAIRANKSCWWSASSGADYELRRAHVFRATHFRTAPDMPRSLFGVQWGDTDPQRLLNECLAYARRTRVRHGLAGMVLWGIHNSGLASEWAHYAFAFVARYQGADYSTLNDTAKCLQGIKGVNWLTLVSSSLLKAVGGERAVRKKLSSRIIVHETAGGLCFQAGEAPLLGDINRGDDLSVYREIGTVLAPVRDREHPPIGKAEPGRFNDKEQDAWLGRFDKPGEVWEPKLANPFQTRKPEHEDLVVKTPLGPRIREAMHEGIVPIDDYAEVYAFAFEGRLKEQLPYLAVAYHGCGHGFWDEIEAYMAAKIKADPALKSQVEQAKAAATERIRKKIEEVDRKAAAPKPKAARKQPKRGR